MFDNNQFDEFFRNRLLDHSSPVNKGAWKSIHRQLGRFKAFHFWKWYIAGTSVVVVTVIAAHFVLSPVKSPVTATTSSSAGTTSSSAATPSSASSAAGSAAATAASSPASSPATATASSSNAGSATNSSATHSAVTSPSSAATSPSSATPAATHNATAYLHSAAVLHPASSLHAAGHTTHHRTTHRTSDPAAGAGPNTRTAGNSPILSTTPGSDAPFTQSRTGSTNSRTGDVNSRTDGMAAQSQSALHPSSHGITSHQLTKLSLVHLSIPAVIRAKAPKPSPQALVARPARTHAGLDWSLEAYVSPNIPNKQFGFSLTAGARLTLAITQRWSATAGFEYTQLNAHETNLSYGLHPGHFSDVDLPVLIGYTFIQNDNYTLTVHAGAIFSLYSQAKGQLADYPFGNRRGASAHLGFTISKPLNDQWSIFAEPYGRCLFSNINAFNPYPHKLFTEGITLGIRYNFGK